MKTGSTPQPRSAASGDSDDRRRHPGGARRLASRRVHDGRVFAVDVDKVVEPGEVLAEREVVRHRGSVAVLPVHDDGRLVLVRQYRYPVDTFVWELPAGRLEDAETPAQAAGRELEEETGLRAAMIEPLITYYSTPGFCDERLHLFRATELSTVPPRPESDERIEVNAFSLEGALAMISSGEIHDGKTVIAVLWENERSRRSP